MMDTDRLTSIKATVRQTLAHYPAVQAAYLFGSHANGLARSNSDVDLALVGPRAALQTCKLDILADLTARGLDRIDLVLLDGAPTVVRFEAVHANCLLYALPDFDHGRFFSLCVREYFDLQPYLRIQRQAMKERLLHGET